MRRNSTVNKDYKIKAAKVTESNPKEFFKMNLAKHYVEKTIKNRQVSSLKMERE